MGRPVVRGPIGGAVTPDVPVTLGGFARGARIHKPWMLVARVVWYPIEHYPQPALMGFTNETVESLQIAEDGVYVAIITDIVSEIRHRRRENRRQPNGVDSEPLQVVKLLTNALEISDTIGISVGK